MVDKIGPTPIIALILIALLLIAARSASLALEATTPEVKRQSSRKEVHMNRQLILGSASETAWAAGMSAIVGALPSFP
jgi:hypothetical protein